MDQPDPGRLCLTRDAARRLDQLATERFAIPSLLLMENAAIALAGAVSDLLAASHASRTIIVCGPGNNGGDGLALARHLHASGVDVHVAISVEPLRYAGDPAVYMAIVERLAIPLTVLCSGADALVNMGETHPERVVVVDALFGTGLTRPLEGHMAAMVESINSLAARGAVVCSVDVPSGLDADSGRPLGVAVRAHTTVTFVAPKAGFASLEAEGYLGNVRVAGIGVPRSLLAELGRPVARLAHRGDEERPAPEPVRPRRGRGV